MAETATRFSPAWLKIMKDRAKESTRIYGSPGIPDGFYAASITKENPKISNGKAWWNNPVVVQEIHEYADGTVCTYNYIEGVKTFEYDDIVRQGLLVVRHSELPDLLGIAKVVYFDHRQIDEKGRALRIVHDMRETEAAE